MRCRRFDNCHQNDFERLRHFAAAAAAEAAAVNDGMDLSAASVTYQQCYTDNDVDSRKLILESLFTLLAKFKV